MIISKSKESNKKERRRCESENIFEMKSETNRRKQN